MSQQPQASGRPATAEQEQVPGPTGGIAGGIVDGYDSVGFDATLGVELVEADGDHVILTCPVRPALAQPYGILHGGVHCSLVESAASIGAALWLGDAGNVVGVSNHTNFLRAVRDGVLTVTAVPVQRGRTMQLWRVTISHQPPSEGADSRDVAVGEVRLANLRSADTLGRSAGA